MQGKMDMKGFRIKFKEPCSLQKLIDCQSPLLLVRFPNYYQALVKPKPIAVKWHSQQMVKKEHFFPRPLGQQLYHYQRGTKIESFGGGNRQMMFFMIYSPSCGLLIFIQLMRATKVLSLLLLCLLLAAQGSSLQIHYVSKLPGSISSPAVVSLKGGAMIYLKVTGHNPMASGNKIYVGTFPCIVPSDGVSDTFIACETTDTGSKMDIDNLPVTIISYNTAYTTTGWPNSVYFRDSHTPSLTELFPASGFAGSKINFYGIHRIAYLGDGQRDMGDITKILLGRDICSRFDIQQANISVHGYNYITCIQSQLQEGGRYNVTEQVIPGFARRNTFLRRSSLIPGEYFQYASLPTVTAVTPNLGNNGGQNLSITGTGFSLNKQNNSVLVDGNPCSVTYSDEGTIKCTIAPKDPALSSRLVSNSTNQSKPYFSGAGLNYARYKFTTSIAALVNAVRSNNASTLGVPQEVGYRAELREGDVYGTYYSQTWNGYFTAPVTGEYTFIGTSDDAFSFYLADVPGSAELPAIPLISSDSYQLWNDFYAIHRPTASATVALQEGMSYYLEAYHINWGGTGNFRIEVSVPNNDSALSFQTYQVDEILLNSTVQPEVLVYTMAGGSNGTFNIRIYRAATADTAQYDVNADVDYACSASDFAAALNKFDLFKSFQISVERTIYDSGNNVITSVSGAAKITYTVSVYLIRDQTAIPSFIYDKKSYDGNFIQPTTRIQHSSPVSGTFTLTIGGVTIDPYKNGTLSYNAPSADIQKFMRENIVGFEDVEVSLTSPNSCKYTCSWFIKYKNYNQQQGSVVVSTAGLSGPSPTMVARTRRDYSPNVLFNPIDYRFLSRPSSSPSVIVRTNGVPSVCTGACQYTFDLFSEVTALSINGSVLSLAISDPTSKGFTAAQIKVTVQGLPCVVDTNSAISALTCQLPVNNDSSLALVADNNTIPAVWVGEYGLAALAANVTGFAVPLVVNPLNVSSGGTNGGYVIEITGSGFPTDKRKISITLCGAAATIKTTTSTRVSFYVPSCSSNGSQTLTVRAGSATDNSQSFLYVEPFGAPTVISLSPASANPGVKGVLEINGNNFGNDSSLLTVFLSNSSGKVYQLSVLEASNTYLKVGLAGGLAGTFTVHVNLEGAGDSVAAVSGSDLFRYVVSIISVSPASGSIHGGSLLTISGQNFAPAAQQTLVFIGTTLNWFCSIESMTETAIQCRTPAISEDYLPGVPQEIFVTTRLIVESECVGSCSFSYLSAASSPSLTNLTVSGSVVSLNGTVFTAGSSCSVSLSHSITKAVTVVAASACSATAATFSIPATLVSGKYNVRVRSEFGESNSLPLSVLWSAGSRTPTSGATSGTLVTFTGGSGFPLDLSDGQFSVVIRDASNNYLFPGKVVSCCAGNSITVQMPPAADTTYFSINFVGPVNSFKGANYVAYASYSGALSLASNATVPPGLNTVSLSITKASTEPIASIVLVSKRSALHNISVSSWTVNGTVVSFQVPLTTGAFGFLVRGVSYFYVVNDVLEVEMPTNVVTTAQSYSYNGGLFTISAVGLSPVSNIRVNSLVGRVVRYDLNSSSVTYQLPPLLTPLTQTTYSLAKPALLDLASATFFSDVTNGSTAAASFDGSISTFYASTNAACWVGIDFGEGLRASVSRFRFFPNLNWVNTASKILDGQFQGSNDLASWSTLSTVDQTVHSGWNTLVSGSSGSFRYVRFAHTSASQCNIAEIQLYGNVYSSASIADLASKPSDVIYEDGLNSVPFPARATYAAARTAIVTAFSPRYGDTFGGYTLTLTGSNLDFDTPSVVIDGVTCGSATVINSTTITCTVGARPSMPASSSLEVRIGASAAILRATFYYVLRWSDKRTWGVDLPPIDGDLVAVPAGMTLLVDQDTPNLRGIAATNATLIFSDERDLTVNAGFITVVGGRFIAGTEEAPHQHRLDFILHGDYYDVQQPMFGNKGIGCMECALSIYGRPRTPTWTTLAAPIAPGASTLTLAEDVDWQAGEEIVVASTSFYHWEAERRTITAVSGRTLTLNASFLHAHAASIETYGSGQLPMVAEVGLLTRNIRMRGDDATTMVKQYGSHLMIAGQSVNGAEGRVAYAEFTQCGQPAILGRYCIHFHMNGDVPTSYVRGNAVHDSLARVVTLHAVFYLTVELNVGYRVRGHNFFVEDGIETHNTIRNNLAIGSLVASNMLATDTSVASFWVTNPTNHFYGNRAAGSDFYGIWYEIKTNPDGPSATSDVCPIGNPLGNVHDNVAHSNVRFGLRIFKLQSRRFPCEAVRDDSNGTDPWFANPASTSLFSNFVLYKNMEDGLLAEQTGNTVFQNFSIGESYHSGVEFYLANFTREPPTVIDSFIVGRSRTNAAADPTNYTLGMSGAITGRSGVTRLTNVSFYNFPPGSILFQTCRLCDDPLKYTNLGTEVVLSRISLVNVTGGLLNMIGLKRDVIYDTDGSLSSAYDSRARRASATIVHGFPHIALSNPTVCPPPANSALWDDAVMCDPSVTVRRVAFTNLDKHQDFASQMMKATELANVNETVPLQLNASQYTSVSARLASTIMESKDKPYSWSLPYITGRTYNIWWASGVDFQHLSAFSSPSFVPEDSGIIFKFNYSENRELYRVGPVVGGRPLVKANYFAPSPALLDASSCQNGQYFHDNNDNSSSRMFTLCQSAKNKTLFEYTDVTGVVCEMVCPLPPGTFVLEDFLRYWSNATQWPGGVVPRAGDNVTVKGEWRLVLDMDPLPINNLTIDGNLIADDSRDVTIVANFIFIRAGNFTAGSAGNPFTHKLNIQLNGQKTDTARTIDPLLTGNKMLVVSGSLNLFGKPPASVITTLTETAFSGDRVIKVGDSTDWAVGDSISLAPSFSLYSEFETGTIESISAVDGSITLTAPLRYTHYGDQKVTVSSGHGDLDARARVGHLSRNIRISAGADAGWGFSVVVYGYTDTALVRRVGSAQLVGVQFVDGGQLDSTNSPLVFRNLIGGNFTSRVSSSSFANCKAFCINVDNAHNVSLTKNVLYNAWVFGVQALAMQDFTFANNLIVGISARPTIEAGQELIACFSSLFYVNARTHKVRVTDNVCQGSVGHGWAVPHIGCDELEINPFANNTIGSASIGFIFNKIDQECQGFSYIKAYACGIGQIMGPPSSKSIVLEHFVLADNGRGATLKMGASEGRTNHTAFFSNSFITPVSRPNCLYCYGSSATGCVNNIGVRLFTASNNGEMMPGKFGAGFDVVCKQPVFDSKAYLTNVVFDNFKQNYSGAAVGPVCSSNFVFRPHTGGFDMVGGTYLTGCNCTGCDGNSYVKCDAPDESQLGWFGGCGDLLCTGKQNYQITDWTGGFLGGVGTVIANNSVIGDNEPGCVFSAAMNGHRCNRTDFAALEYQSIAADFKTRVMWPVNLTYEGSNYTTVTNGWREWEWLGKEPQNQRFGRFVSLVSLFKTYNMTFSAVPPHNLQLQLQTRTLAGNNSNYIIVKLYYPLPNSIKLTVNNVVVKPLLLTNRNNASSLLAELNTSQCGSNIYFYNNNTIQFVLTEARDCTAVLSLVDSITLTTHFAMNIEEFFASNVLTNFINNICAMLQITDTSRVKVVGVYTGSLQVTAQIEAETIASSNTVSSSTPVSNPSSLTAMYTLLSNQISDGSFSSIMAANIAPVTTVVSTPNYIEQPSASEEPSKLPLIIGVAVGGVLVTAVIIMAVMFVVRKRAKVMEDMVSEESFPQENEEKNQDIFGKPSIHPEQSNIMLRNQKTTTFEVKEIEVQE